jgi:general nucleoside transport system ATP-binding protein
MGAAENEADNFVLEMKGISKQFPKVLANDNISITLQKGEILCLLGENGAGKSTLMNILYGLIQPTSGEILLNGRKTDFSSPRDAIEKGLGMVHQHFMLVDTLSVTENIILGNEPANLGFIDTKAARRRVREISEKYHLAIDPDAVIENIAVGLQQRVEILKALYREAKILILDEPTAVLTPQEVDELFDVIRGLRDRGVSIIIITHKLEEVMEISDRVYILRGGRMEGERVTKDVTKEELANLMVGREVVLTVEKKAKQISGEPSVILDDLYVYGDKNISALEGLSLQVRPGEIVGIAGVDGNGQSELAEAIMGLREIDKGKILLNGKDLARVTTRQRIEQKFSYVPADRQRFGLVMSMEVSENIMMGQHLKEPFSKGINLNLPYIEEYSEKLVDAFDIRTPSVHVPASTLSGGNQQKVILAREFSRDPKFLLVSQPTRGLDVGAIEYIHAQILRMRDENTAILLISLELEEIFSLSDRILVLYEGKIVKEFMPDETDEKEVGFYMTGGKAKEPQHAE